jgi:hypothetical protein
MRVLGIVLGILMAGCTGQNLYIPVKTQGRDRDGNTTAGVRAIPIFKNTGNLANAKYAFSGGGYRVSFTADVVDNATTTAALHEGINKTIRAGGSVIGTAMAGMAGIVAAQGLADYGIATANAAASKNAANAATRQSQIAAESAVKQAAIRAGTREALIGAGPRTIRAIGALRP